MENSNDFGGYLKQLRTIKGFSVNQLALYSGVSSSQLSRIENGKRGAPKPDTIKKIAESLDIPYKELMEKAGYINNEITQDALELMNNSDVESLFDYAFSQLIDSITVNGYVVEDICDMMLEAVKDIDPDGNFINKESVKHIDTWKIIYENLTFQEKIDFLLLLKNENLLSVGYDTDKNVNKVAENVGDYYTKNDFQLNSPLIRVPVLGYIAAGQPILAEEHIDNYEYIPNLEKYNDCDFFILNVKGDSMEGSRIYSGDQVLVKIQPEVENGEIAVVNVNGEEATLKKVKKYEDGSIWLISTNEKYAPIPLNDDNARIVGKVIRVMFEP